MSGNRGPRLIDADQRVAEHQVDVVFDDEDVPWLLGFIPPQAFGTTRAPREAFMTRPGK